MQQTDERTEGQATGPDAGLLVDESRQEVRRALVQLSPGLREAVARLLVREGYLSEIQVTEFEGRKRMRAYIKRDIDGKHIISTIERVSKPGCRVYRRTREIERVLRGMGTGI